MRTLLTLYRKELKQYFLTPFGWVVLACIMIMQGLSLSSALEQYAKAPAQENLLYSIFSTPHFWFYFLFIFPLITMRLFAEEEHSGTMETLMTAPVRTWHVVLAKYGSALTFYASLWLPILLHIKLFSFITNTPAPVNSGQIQGAFLILLLIGVCFTAVGCLASALTSNQIIAGVIGTGMLVFHYFLGFVPHIAGDSFQGAALFHYISIQEHIAIFTKGLLDFRAVAFYLSLTFFLIILTHHIVDYRRWKR